ncbi:3,4-dihydroxy 2-butanone 4-phosphate synthase/GTP cyclohydrolase II [Williamsia limnetica]|uniref:Riboflavin biosynthesis protein RibBA n=1 Tax=Williamsia limnetica TaxID=882452 RepID=A0A318RF62_WILLI|nr:3,4-dihydroxy-2-butanone-4-phosphate synthase [Williamsia limnetica]PYE12429.1 3,4-dihydroxy 2-butanone 4-phosphate synthase/GTP cyclohydrolase II [Williamsia limnetica]
MNTARPDIDAALRALRAGGMVVVVDDPDRENEGDLIMAAEFATTGRLAFMVRHTTGIICVPMGASRADDLGLPLMVEDNTDAHGTAFTVTVDALGSGTGVSAADRAHTIRALAASATRQSDLRMPGHVFPLRARAGGVLERPGHTEAAVDLMRLSGLTEVGVIGELIDDDGGMLRGAALSEFADRHQLPMISVAQLVEVMRPAGPALQRRGSADLPTEYGNFRAHAFFDNTTGVEHLALTMGDVAERSDVAPLVRLHSECLTGDLAGSLRCDCGHQLRESLTLIAAEGKGVLVYLCGHEGRGIGLGRKLEAYSLQERGRDTVDANAELGLPIDSRDYSVGAHILAELGTRHVRLITNNPDKCSALAGNGIVVQERIGVPGRVTDENIAYLRTKRDRMGHLIDLGEKPSNTA